MSVSKEMRTRVVNDMHIVYATECDEANSTQEQFVEVLKNTLKEDKYRYTTCKGSLLAGHMEQPNQVDHMTQADFIVCLLSVSPKTGCMCKKLVNNVRLALNIKGKQSQANRVIPVFCDMTEAQAQQVKETYLPELIPVVHVIARQDDTTWTEKVMELFKVTPSVIRLVDVYLRILPDKCCPLFRLEDTCHVQKDLFDLYLPPKFTLKEFRKWKLVNESPLANLSSIIEVAERADPGSRIIVVAPGGVGKSAFSSQATRQWCHIKALDNYQFLYLLMPRYIQSHRESVQHIICTDLELHDESIKMALGKTIKYSAEKIMFIIDGYDEVNVKDQKNSTLNDLIEGKVARNSTVVVTTRPHCRGEIISFCNGNYSLVSLDGLTPDASREYIEKISEAEYGDAASREQVVQQIMENIPPEAMHVPLLLNMAVLIYQWNKRHSTDPDEYPRSRTVTSVMGRIIGMYLGLQEEKERGADKVPVFISPLDENVPAEKKVLIKSFAQMCYKSVMIKNFNFTKKFLKKYKFNDRSLLSRLGFLEITTDCDDNVSSARCVHNQILEYCAALHITNDNNDLKKLIKLFSGPDDDTGDTSSEEEEEEVEDEMESKMGSCKGAVIAEKLAFWKDTLLFAVGIKSSILGDISKSRFTLRVAVDRLDKSQKCLDLSYEARLMHEAEESIDRRAFCEALMEAPLFVTTSSEPCLPTLSSLNTLLEALGEGRVFDLFKTVYGDDMSEDEQYGGRALLKGRRGKMVLLGSMPVMTCLRYFTLVDTQTLVIKHADLRVTSGIEKVTDGSVNHIELSADVTCNVQQIGQLVHLQSSSDGLHTLSLSCWPEAVTTEAADRQKVQVLVIKNCKLTMIDVVSLTKHLELNKIVMEDVTLFVEGKDDERCVFEKVSLALNLHQLLCYFTDTCGHNILNKDVYKGEEMSVEKLTMTNSSLSYLRLLTSLMKIQYLYIDGSLINDIADNDVQQTHQYIWLLNVDCHLRLSTLVQLCLIVGRVEKLRLWKQCEIQNDLDLEAKTTQDIVIYIAELIVCSKMSLENTRALCELGQVRKLFLGDEPSSVSCGCEIISKQESVALPGVVTLVLCGVLGLSDMCRQMKALEVCEVKILKWGSNDQEDRVTESQLKLTCPKACLQYFV